MSTVAPTHPRGFADLAAAFAFRAFDYPDPNPHAAYRVWHCTCRQCGHLCATLREQADGSPPVVGTIRRTLHQHLAAHAAWTAR